MKVRFGKGLTAEGLAVKVMDHLFGRRSDYVDGWDKGSPAHRFWKKYCVKNLRHAKSIDARTFYAEVRRRYSDE